MPKSGGDKQNDKNSEHNHSDFSPRNYLHILYHSLRLDKPNCSGRESINSHCRRFGSICCRYDHSCRRSDYHRTDRTLAIDRDRDRSGRPFSTVRWFIQQNTRAATRFLYSLWVLFSLYTFLGRAEAELRCELVRGRTYS